MLTHYLLAQIVSHLNSIPSFRFKQFPNLFTWMKIERDIYTNNFLGVEIIYI